MMWDLECPISSPELEVPGNDATVFLAGAIVGVEPPIRAVITTVNEWGWANVRFTFSSREAADAWTAAALSQIDALFRGEV
jgi:hypothetical protein